MRNAALRKVEPARGMRSGLSGATIGHIIAVNSDGTVLVDYPGNWCGGLPARFTSDIPAEMPSSECAKYPVLLLFENNDPQLPIIVGFVRASLSQPKPRDTLVVLDRRPERVEVDRERLVLDASREVVIRCGKSSIALRADGKVVIKGTELVSRASAVNKIKGATVAIN